MSARRYTAIVERDESGTITISPRKALSDDASGDFRQVVGIAGALAWTDVRDRRLTVTTRIERMGVASWWLRRLYGEAVEEAAVALSRSEEPGSRKAVAERTPLARTFGRLLLGVWMRRWWPAPATAEQTALSEWLLDAESGTLAWDSEELYGSVAPARELLEPRAFELTKALYSPVPADAALRETLSRAARASLDAIPVDHPAHERLGSAAQQFAEQASPAERSPAAAVVTWLDSLREPMTGRGRLAFVAGDHSGGETVAEGAALLDPASIHPRSVSGSDDAARWSVERFDDGDWLTITVDLSGTTIDDVVNFFADVHLDTGEALAVGFTRDDDTARGTVLLPPGALPVGIELNSWEYATPRRGRPDPESGQARRAALREFREERERHPARRGKPWGPFAAELADDGDGDHTSR
ncbi:MAG TPA: hypothetical protein VNR36_05040 [Pseudolysinimonas sp.]|nr:hypothetical protein [Pseudolysinimonas sp.]